MKGDTQTDSILSNVGAEMKSNPPAILASTRRKFGAARAESQRKAILLSKSRKMGAKIPSPNKSLGGR